MSLPASVAVTRTSTVPWTASGPTTPRLAVDARPDLPHLPVEEDPVIELGPPDAGGPPRRPASPLRERRLNVAPIDGHPATTGRGALDDLDTAVLGGRPVVRGQRGFRMAWRSTVFPRRRSWAGCRSDASPRRGPRRQLPRSPLRAAPYVPSSRSVATYAVQRRSLPRRARRPGRRSPSTAGRPGRRCGPTAAPPRRRRWARRSRSAARVQVGRAETRRGGSRGGAHGLVVGHGDAREGHPGRARPAAGRWRSPPAAVAVAGPPPRAGSRGFGVARRVLGGAALRRPRLLAGIAIGLLLAVLGRGGLHERGRGQRAGPPRATRLEDRLALRPDRPRRRPAGLRRPPGRRGGGAAGDPPHQPDRPAFDGLGRPGRGAQRGRLPLARLRRDRRPAGLVWRREPGGSGLGAQPGRRAGCRRPPASSTTRRSTCRRRWPRLAGVPDDRRGPRASSSRRRDGAALPGRRRRSDLRAAFPQVRWFVGPTDLRRWRGQLDYWVFTTAQLGRSPAASTGRRATSSPKGCRARSGSTLTATDRDRRHRSPPADDRDDGRDRPSGKRDRIARLSAWSVSCGHRDGHRRPRSRGRARCPDADRLPRPARDRGRDRGPVWRRTALGLVERGVPAAARAHPGRGHGRVPVGPSHGPLRRQYDPDLAAAFQKLEDVLPEASPNTSSGPSTSSPSGRRRGVQRARPPADQGVGRATGRRDRLRPGRLRAEAAARNAVVRPYLIEPSLQTHALYLIGWDETRDAVRTFKIERIRDVALTRPFEAPTRARSRALAARWDIIADQEPVEVVCASRPPWRPGSPRRRGIRPSAPGSQPDGSLLWGATVSGTIEIRLWILSWGADVEVLAPDSSVATWRRDPHRPSVHGG